MGNQASVVLHEQTVCLSSVSSFLFSFPVWISRAPTMVVYRNTFVITQRESWHAGGIMKREEAVLAVSFFISHQFLMSSQFRFEEWGSRKWREKKKNKQLLQPQQKPRKQQHVQRGCLLLSWRTCFHTQLCLIFQTHFASDAETLVL